MSTSFANGFLLPFSTEYDFFVDDYWKTEEGREIFVSIIIIYIYERHCWCERIRNNSTCYLDDLAVAHCVHQANERADLFFVVSRMTNARI